MNLKKNINNKHNIIFITLLVSYDNPFSGTKS